MGGSRWCQLLAPALFALGASVALAQTPLKQWPDQAPQQQQPTRAWPGDTAPQQASAPPAAAPPAPMMMPPPQMGGSGAPMGARPPQLPPAVQACLDEFNRLRGEVEKKGAVAKATSDRRGSREEMCVAITGIHVAQTAWVKYTVANASKCGIPPEAIKQLRQGQDHLGKLRRAACSAGPAQAGPAPAPSLSEALGTAGLPPATNSGPEENRKRGGVLDNMTGTRIR